MASTVVRASSFEFTVAGGSLAEGLTVALMAGPEQGSVHLEVALSRLEPEGRIAGHRHFYEESFYVLSGEAMVSIDGHGHHLVANDFGFVPAAFAHAWANVGTEPVTWFRMRSPQPRQVGATDGTFAAEGLTTPTDGAWVGDQHPAVPYVGHFADEHLPAPGPLALRGYRGPNVRNASVWMLVDEFTGALHHTMFIVQFLPGSTTHPAGDHFHPFEEAYYFLQGSAIAYLDGSALEVRAGDLVFAGTNALHGYEMTSEEPGRWIEGQAPAPTASGAFIFPSQWESHGGRGAR